MKERRKSLKRKYKMRREDNQRSRTASLDEKFG
jgi:hypothetical protein